MPARASGIGFLRDGHEILGKLWIRFKERAVDDQRVSIGNRSVLGSGLNQPEDGFRFRPEEASLNLMPQRRVTPPSSHTAPLKFASSLRVSFSHIMREFLMDCPAQILEIRSY
jgi:hypothetical protein